MSLVLRYKQCRISDEGNLGVAGMPRVRKKVIAKGKSQPVATSAAKPAQELGESRPGVVEPVSASAKSTSPKTGQRKRGWRDIEAISERARLKKMLVDIWHEDIELDDDIFGDSDHLSGYYTEFEEAEIESEISPDLIDEAEDFEEKEE